MHTHYGDRLPLRILDEIEFWKRQENEHTTVILTLAPDLEPQLKDALLKWGEAFGQVEGINTRYIEHVVHADHKVSEAVHHQIANLVAYSLGQSEQFVNFLHYLKKNSKAPSIANPVVRVVIDHIRRESEYFIGVSQGLLGGQHK